ncbi:endonuclease/exonuclease/phosphatase family protein [Neptunicoccus cionae]|uniref:endonuclease/exonuclease/phosphatase family protein n=1 Tax=Neptunicoccus cionae TaxID=2035344 RepID=UPI000C779FD7|nr:endonuclease/exonuclease/phosphatase family protein [Amylibacter cionae]PLS21448.1 endonuclease [Amylibacter cionae]
MQKRTQLRVASYNIRKAVGLDWRRDAERIVQVLHEIDADVVVLQESDKRVGQRSGVLPATRLQSDLGYVLVDLSIRPRSHGWHGNAILYRQGGLNLERSNRIHLPALEPRGAVAARFAEPGLEIIGVHLGLTRRIRARQLSALRAYMERADHPVLMAGDFNIWARGGQTGDLLGREAEMVLPGNSFHAARPTAPLDRFVLRGGIRQVSSHVHYSALAAKASDHLPVVIDAEVSHPCM